jgi:hypothetical protein
MVSAWMLTLVLYSASLVSRYARAERLPKKIGGGLLPALAVAVMAVNPFFYAFDRLAILEPGDGPVDNAVGLGAVLSPRCGLNFV